MPASKGDGPMAAGGAGQPPHGPRAAAASCEMDEWQLVMFAKVAQRCRVKVVSHGLPPETLRKCYVEPAATVEHGPVLNGNFDPFSADHLKCYDAPPFPAGPRAVVTLNDPFSVETITLRPGPDRLALVCAPAIKTVEP